MKKLYNFIPTIAGIMLTSSILLGLLAPFITEMEKRELLHPITISTVPEKIIEVKEEWKGGKYTVGYRIITTEEYIISSGRSGLFGQEGAFGGPGKVNSGLISSFGVIAKLAEEAKEKKVEMIFSGEIIYNCNDEPYIYEGKKVIFLSYAKYGNKKYEVYY